MNGSDNLQKIRDILVRMKGLTSVSESDYLRGEIDRLDERIRDNVFCIAVVGEFSSGKSTFINALIGKDILSHARQETTAAITYILNVQQDDERCGSGVIEYRDGTEKTLERIEDIGIYTTAQSESRVAETIRSVTLYVNFLGVKTPVLIIDTPGLNGIAEHHREITLDEVKKAHTCMYLLSSSGVSDSDALFIRYLTDYQNDFLFLQNFIDDLSDSEGDTVESKIEDDEKSIRETFIERGKNFHYKIIGISALKALVSRDRSIKKLYSNEFSKELTDEDRPRLFIESQFQQLEQYLEELIETGKYKEVIIDSAAKRLRVLLEGLLGQLDEEQQLNRAMRENDQTAQKLISSQAILEQIKSKQEDREKRIRNFVKSCSAEQRRLLENNIRERLQSLYEEICKDIEDKIKDYQTFIGFSKTYGKSISYYYSQFAEGRISEDIAHEFLKVTDLILHHIYEKTVARVESYAGREIKADNISFTVDPLTDVFQMGETDSLNSIEAIEASIRRCEDQIKDIDDQIRTAQSRTIEADKSVRAAQNACDSCAREKSRAVSELGRRPEKRYWETSRYVRDYRDGLFGSLIDVFNKKYKEVKVPHTDDSEGEAWDRKYSEVQRRYIAKERELSNKLEDAESNREYIEAEIRYKRSERSKREEEIEGLREQLSIQKEIYANEVKISQGKFCERQKSKLKANIEDRLINSSNPLSTLNYFEEYLRSVFERNEEAIEKKGVEALRKCYAEQIASLKAIIEQSSDDLDKRYQSSSVECETIQSIYDEVCQITN